LIGVGGMTNVYCARDELLKRRVAVKVLAEPLASEPRCVRQFRREAELWAELMHPRIVAVFDRRDAAAPVHSRGARARRDRPGARPWTPATEPRPRDLDRREVADALAFAHDDDVIHCDVAPGNVLIRRSDQAVKLTDFGLACRPGGRAATYDGGVAGTYGYMAPEVLGGEAAGPLSDLYSLGALAYRLLAGPPDGRSAAGAELPAVVADVIDRALEHDPNARQPSVAEFRAQLLEAHRPRRVMQHEAA
jgi:serine/threonine-protein kinase